MLSWAVEVIGPPLSPGVKATLNTSIARGWIRWTWVRKACSLVIWPVAAIVIGTAATPAVFLSSAGFPAVTLVTETPADSPAVWAECSAAAECPEWVEWAAASQECLVPAPLAVTMSQDRREQRRRKDTRRKSNYVSN